MIIPSRKDPLNCVDSRVRSKDGKDTVCISYGLTEREETVKQRFEGDMQRDARY